MKKTKDNQFEIHFVPITSASEAANKLDRDRNRPSMSAPVSACQSPFSFSSDRHSSTAPFPPENGVDHLSARKNSPGRRSSFAYRIREHVRTGPKFSETVKGKLSVGAKIIKKGGRENLFQDVFGMNDEEKLLKASQCYQQVPLQGFYSSPHTRFASAVRDPSLSTPLPTASSGPLTRCGFQ